MRKNIITFIKLIIILCVIVIAVRVGNYKKPENKIIYTPTPILAHERELKIINLYYLNCMNNENLGQWSAMYKTADWLNKKIPSSPPIPKGIVKAYIVRNIRNEGTGIKIIFNDGQNRHIMIYPYYPPGPLILK